MANHTFNLQSFNHDGRTFNIDVDVAYEWEGDASDPDSLLAEVDAIDIQAFEVLEDGTEIPVINPLLIKQLEDAVCQECVIDELDSLDPDDVDLNSDSDGNGYLDE